VNVKRSTALVPSGSAGRSAGPHASARRLRALGPPGGDPPAEWARAGLGRRRPMRPLTAPGWVRPREASAPVPNGSARLLGLRIPHR
jgi:hypothetical protein